MLQLVDVLQGLRTDYRFLLTLIPPPPNKAGEEAKESPRVSGVAFV